MLNSICVEYDSILAEQQRSRKCWRRDIPGKEENGRFRASESDHLELEIHSGLVVQSSYFTYPSPFPYSQNEDNTYFIEFKG